MSEHRKILPYKAKETASQNMRKLFDSVGSQPPFTQSQTQSSQADVSLLDSSLLTSTPVSNSKSSFSKTSSTQDKEMVGVLKC